MITDSRETHHEMNINKRSRSGANIIVINKCADHLPKICNRVTGVSFWSCVLMTIGSALITNCCNQCNQERTRVGATGGGTCKTTRVGSINLIIRTYFKIRRIVCGFLVGGSGVNVEIGSYFDGIEKDYKRLTYCELSRAVKSGLGRPMAQGGKCDFQSTFWGSAGRAGRGA